MIGLSNDDNDEKENNRDISRTLELLYIDWRFLKMKKSNDRKFPILIALFSSTILKIHEERNYCAYVNCNEQGPELYI